MLRRARDLAGAAAVVVFLITAGRSIAKMGPTPDGTCATSPTCPNSHQWVALLVLACVCVVFAALATFDVARVRWGGAPLSTWAWLGTVATVAVAVAILVVDPPSHLNSPQADWFGHSLSDGSLN